MLRIGSCSCSCSCSRIFSARPQSILIFEILKKKRDKSKRKEKPENKSAKSKKHKSKIKGRKKKERQKGKKWKKWICLFAFFLHYLFCFLDLFFIYLFCILFFAWKKTNKNKKQLEKNKMNAKKCKWTNPFFHFSLFDVPFFPHLCCFRFFSVLKFCFLIFHVFSFFLAFFQV